MSEDVITFPVKQIMKNKQTILDHLYQVIVYIFIAIMLFLTVYSFLYSHIFESCVLEMIVPKRDNIPAVLIFSFGSFAGISFLVKHFPPAAEREYILFAGGTVLYLLICFLIYFDKTPFHPAGDPLFIYQAAAGFLKGDFSALQPGGYLYQYPYQLGLMTYDMLWIKLAGEENYMVLIFVNFLSLACTGIVISLVAKRIYGKKCEVICYILYLLFLPIYFYPCYLYGECLGALFASAFLYISVRFYENQRLLFFLLLILTEILSITFRANSAIMVIAVCIMLAYQAIKNKNGRLLLCILILLFLVKGSGFVTKYIYQQKSQTKDLSGTPAITWIVMGMMEGPRANGWYNQYNDEVFTQNNYNSAKAKEAGLKDFKERASAFLHDPKYALHFYKEKNLSQWNEPTYESLLVFYDSLKDIELNDAKNRILFHEGFRFFNTYMNLLQSFLYLASLMAGIKLLLSKKRMENVFYLLFPTILIGGFLFQTMWEAKSRYIFFYMLFLIPLAACGVTGMEKKSQ